MLNTETRSQMETGFGTDFGAINIHTDNRAVEMNQNLGAHAFTHGNDIYFNEGKYRPETSEGKHLLAHELTHTVQQGSGVRKQKVLAEKRLSESSSTHIQRSSWYEVDIPFTDYHFDPSIKGLKTAANLTKNTAMAGGKFIYDKGKAFLVEQINRIAPGLLEFLKGDWKEIIKNKISNALDKLFGKLISKVQTMGLIGIITNFVGQISGDIISASSSLGSKTQAAASKASRAIFKFVSSLSRPLFKAFQKVSGQFISVLGSIWKKLGLPSFEAVKSVAGGTWDWLKSKAEWVWKQISRVKNLLSEAWDWIKEKFNIAWGGASSVWNWLKEKIKAAWDTVYQFIKPILNPLKFLKSVFSFFTSNGVFGTLLEIAQSFWNYAWVLINFVEFPKLFIKAGVFLKNVVFPYLMKGIKKLQLLLKAGFKWLVAVLDAVSAAFKSLITVLNGVILSVAKAVVQAIGMVFNMVKSMFIGLIGYLVETVNAIINDFWGFLFTLSTFLAGVVSIILNPTNWFPFAAALVAKLAWTLIPNFIKPAAIDFLIKMTIKGLNFLPSPPMLGSLWKVVIMGMTGLLTRIQKMQPDKQIRLIEKLINTGINPRYYAGFQIGVIKGIVWDGLVGLIMTILDLFKVLPELISGIYNFFKEMLTDVESIKKFLRTLKKLGKDVEKFINDPKALDQIVELIKKSPQILLSMVKKAFEVAKNWANEAGDKIVESLFSFILNNDAFKIGLKVGTVVGMILFEILLLFVSGSIGNIVKWGGKALSWVSKGLKMLVKGLKSGAGLIMKGFKAVKTVASAGWKIIKSAVKGGLSKVFNRLKNLMDDIIAWFKKLFQKAFGKKKKAPKKKPKPGKKPKTGEEARWQTFKLAVDAHFAKFQKDGLSKPRVKAEFKKVVLKFKKVARLPFRAVRSKYGFYKLFAKKRKKGIIARNVGKVPMPTPIRWRNGKLGIIKRLKKLKPAEFSTSAINLAIKPYIGKYKYRVLEAKWDSRENDWDIMAEMNPKGKIAEVEKDAKDLHTGSAYDPIPIHWYKRPQDYPLWITLVINNTEEKIPMYGNRQVFWRKYKTRSGKMYRVGVSERNRVYKGRKLKKAYVHGREPSAQRDFKQMLVAKGYNRFYDRGNPKTKDVDHITDLGFGGSNRNSNLWPLKADINQRPVPWRGPNWSENYIIKYKDYENGNVRVKEAAIGKLWGKHFKIIGFKMPPPIPGGKDKS